MESQDLRRAGLKVTLPRLKILEILAGEANRHLSAEDLYKRLLELNEDIGLATVYRVLTQFEAAGLVTRHIFRDGKARYERTGGAPHPHLIDVATGEIVELEDDRSLARLIEEEARRMGFQLVEFRLKLFGEKI